MTLSEQLQQVLGVAPPAAFVELVRIAIREAPEYDQWSYVTHWDAAFDLTAQASVATSPDSYPSIEAVPYPASRPVYGSIPFEFFSFGSAGVDGIHYGFVVHAPELELTDYPVGEVNPSQASAGVRHLGDNTIEGLGFLAGRVRARAEKRAMSDERLARWRELEEELGVIPDAGAGPWAFNPERPPIVPIVPDGWRHVPTADGIGVLAPIDQFAREPLQVDTSYGCDVAAASAASRGFLDEGLPASSLVILREVWANHSFDEAITGRLAPLLRETYRALGRDVLAQAV